MYLIFLGSNFVNGFNLVFKFVNINYLGKYFWWLDEGVVFEDII